MIRRALIVATAVALLSACEVPAEDPTAVQPPESAGPGKSKKPTKKAVPVKISAKRVPYPKEQFATGGPYSCAKVVVTNQTKSNLDVNPYFFAVTGVDGEKREAAVGAAKGEFDSLTLAPGEKASGVVCTETEVAPKTVTFSEAGIDEAARAEVG
jgi:hypothetical protein